MQALELSRNNAKISPSNFSVVRFHISLPRPLMISISRKACLPSLLLVVSTLAPNARAQEKRDFTQPLDANKKILHVLNRLTFGARPGDAERVRQMGVSRWIEMQLHPETIDDSVAERKLSTFETLKMSPQELMLAQLNDSAGFLKKVRAMKQATPNKPATGKEVALNRRQQNALKMIEEAGLERQTSIQAVGELENDKIMRALDSNRQLYEVMVDFWSNHFNIDVKKNLARALKIVDEREVIRPHVFGKFRELLGASAKSPAMLIYLDNASSTREMDLPPRLRQRNVANADANAANAANTAAVPAKKRGGLNENYGREIMELHTLGVDGGYTQKDVTEVARCFTGWSLDRQSGTFVFRAFAHDNGAKEVLGHHIAAGGGIRDGEQVLDILASHPSTAKHIARELCMRLVADEPPASLVEKAAQTFTRTDGDLREVVRTIITSPEFFSTGAYRAKIKSPFEYTVSAIRAMGGTMLTPDPDQTQDRLHLVMDGVSSARANNRAAARGGAKSLALYIASMGQPLYSYQAPTGYPEDSREWVSTGALVSRLNYALDLTGNDVYNVIATPTLLLKGVDEHDRAAIMKRLCDQLLGGDVSSGTRSTLDREAGQDAFVDRAKLTALILGSPEFQRH
jgi:uncharacterized protein (DUF1800 family)